MEFPQVQVDELVAIYKDAKLVEEGTVPYFYMSGVQLPGGAHPSTVDVLLRPVKTDGYDSRLYLSQKPTFASRKNPEVLNWNADGVHILSRNWYAFSWRTQSGLTLAQMMATHLGAMR